MIIQPTSIPQYQKIKQKGLRARHRAISNIKIRQTLRTATKNILITAYENIKGQTVSRVYKKLVRIKTI